MAEAAVAGLFKVGAKIAAKFSYKALAKAALQVALTAAASKVIQNNTKREPQGNLINVAVSSDEPRRLQSGKRLHGGLLVDWYVTEKNNRRLFFVVYLGEGPMGACTGVYAGGRRVANAIPHGVRTNIPDFRSGGDRLWITYYDGRPGQAADPYLVGKSLGWNASHKGTGVAYAIIEMLWDSDNMTSPPGLGVEVEGAKFYDRRLDTTAGGSGAHRLDNPATWTVSKNPAVILDHFLLGRYVNGVKTFGVGLDPVDVPYDNFLANANLCDELVTLKAGGTQKRYEASGFLFADKSYRDTIFELCQAMNARPTDYGGHIGLLTGEAQAPVMTLDESDLVESAPEQYAPKRTWSALISGVEGRYIDPAQNYQPVDYPRVTDASWWAEDAETEAKYLSLDFNMETDPERAQRLAWLRAKRERRQGQLTGTYQLKAIELERGDWFIRSGGKFGAGKTFEVLDRVLNTEDFTVTITAFEVDPSDMAWTATTAKDPADPPTPNTNTLDSIAVPAMTITPVELSYGGVTVPAVRFGNPDWDDLPPLTIFVELAADNGSGGPTGDVVSHTIPAGAVSSTAQGLLPGRGYVARFRALLGMTISAWTDWEQFTSTGDYVAGEATSISWSSVTGAGKPADFADVTGDNISAGFTGQGLLATLNALGYGSQYLTGFGALAALGFVTLGNNLRAANGSTILGDADLITASGVAAAIAGQGAGATANFLSQLDTAAWAALNSDGYMFDNPGLSKFADGSTMPNGFTNWGSVTRQKLTNAVGKESLKMTSADGVYGGIVVSGSAKTPADGDFLAGLYIVDFEVTLRSGTLQGLGLYIYSRLVTTTQDIVSLHVPALRDQNGDLVGDGVVGKTYKFSEVIDLTSGTPDRYTFHLMNNWSGFGSEAAKEVDWTFCGMRPMPRQIAGKSLFQEDGITALLNNDILTALGVASAVTGQGPWATFSDSVLSLTAPNPNIIPDAENVDGTWSLGSISDGYDVVRGKVFVLPANFTVAGSQVFTVAPNNPYTLSYEAEITGGGTVYCDMIFYDAAMQVILDGIQDVASSPHYFPTRRGSTYTAPANAAYAQVRIVSNATGYGYVRRIKAEGGTVRTPWSVANVGDGADNTGNNIASGIVSQGALATESVATSSDGQTIDGSITLASGVWTTIASHTLDVKAGTNVLFLGETDCNASNNSAIPAKPRVRVTRNGTPIRTKDMRGFWQGSGGQGGTGYEFDGGGTILELDKNVPAGTYTYALQAYITANTTTRDCFNRTALAINYKF